MIVSGGTGAIGSAIVRRLQASGHSVAVLAHPNDADTLADWQSSLVAACPVELCDAANYDAVTAAMTKLTEALGGCDGLINAAGITDDSRFSKMSPAQWSRVLSTNLDSVFNLTKSVFETMCSQGFGRIVSLSSVNGQKGQFGQANYAASKAGIHGMMMSLALEGAAYGVTANTVSPGYVDSPMTRAVKADVLDKIVASIPARRMASVEEIAHAVCFLASEESGYITGVNLPVNGGLFISH